MALSVIDPLGFAWRRMVQVLFRPFNLAKWLGLGLCAFLASLGEGGAGPNFGGNFGGHGGAGGGPGHDLHGAMDWLRENLALVILVAAVGFLILLAIGLLVTWLSCRGKFMFIDGIVRNRGAVVEPWRQFAPQANSLFWFRVVFGLVGLVIFFLIAGLALAIAMPDIMAEEFGAAAVCAVVVAVVLLIPYVFIAVAVGLVLGDLVVPTMYLRRLGALSAWGVVWREMLKVAPGTVVLYFLARLVLGAAAGMVALFGLCLACCCTCCLAGLPYVSTVILLPVLVFMQCYTLYFIEGFGPAWRFIADAGGPATV